MIDHPNRNSEIFHSYHQITFVLKCFGLYPLVMDPEKRRHPWYQLLNFLAILTAVFIYGYILFNFSLESEIIRIYTGSSIIQRMLDIFHISQYVEAVVVPVFAFLTLDKTHRMLRQLEEANEMLLDFGGKGMQSTLAGTGRIVRIMQLVALVIPLSGAVVFSVIWEVFRSKSPVGFVLKAIKLMCLYTYAQLLMQPTLLMMMIRVRFAALNRMVR